MKYLIFLSIFFIACATFPQEAPISPHNYVLDIEQPAGGYATAIAVGPNKVLTAAHVFLFRNTKIGGYFVDEVLKVDFNNDCMLLTLKGANFPTYLKPEDFAKDVALGEPVITAGFPFNRAFYDWARVSRIEIPNIYINRNVPQGASGSPVFNLKGKFIGMITRKAADQYGGSHTKVLGFVLLKSFLYN